MADDNNDNDNNNATQKVEESSSPPDATSPKDQNDDGVSSYLQHLSIDQVFGRLFAVFQQRWALFLSVAALAVLTQYVLSVLVLFISRHIGLPTQQQQMSQAMFWHQDVTRRFLEDNYNNNADDAVMDDAYVADDAVAAYDDAYSALDEYDYDQGEYYPTSPWMLLVSFIHTAVYYTVIAISDGALIRAVTEIYANQTPQLTHTLRAALVRLGPLVGAPLLVGIPIALVSLVLFTTVAATGNSNIVLLLTVLFFVAMMVITVVTYHIYPAIVVENKGVVDSIKRSWSLSDGHRLYIFLIQFLFACLKFVANLVVAMIALSFAGQSTTLYLVVMNILNLMYLTLFAALGSILQAVVYFSVRSAKEGLTQEQLAEEAGLSLATPYKTMEEPGEVVSNLDNSGPDKSTPFV